MKKIAITFTALVFVAIGIFYFIINAQTGLQKKDNLEKKTEEQEYCLYKKGELRTFKGAEFCIVNGVDKNIDDFFIESLPYDVETTEIYLEKNL